MATLSERLAERAKKSATEKGRGRAAFLALKPEIQAALNEGWVAKEIWSLLKDEGKIAISYSVFLRYIRDGGMKGNAPAAPPLVPATTAAVIPAAGQKPELVAPQESPAGASSFKIDSRPDKGSLV